MIEYFLLKCALLSRGLHVSLGFMHIQSFERASHLEWTVKKMKVAFTVMTPSTSQMYIDNEQLVWHDSLFMLQ